MIHAFETRDTRYEGIFFTAVRSTGIFCRPTCPAKKPKRDNVEFFSSVADALATGYRACMRCRPLEPEGAPPPWLRPLLADVERLPDMRWSDSELRARSIDPTRVRRGFKNHHGMSFQAYVRARRLGRACVHIRHGQDLTQAAYGHGYESLSGFRDAFHRRFGETPGRSHSTPLIVFNRLLTPLGPMVAGASDDGLCLLEFADRPMLENQIRRLQARLRAAIAPGDNEHIAQIDEELRDYFAGKLTEFRVTVCLPGSEFQRKVWETVRQIPFGSTSSYDMIARLIGQPQARRAVGRANGDNRIAIVIPCHRVVAADGSLGGYGGGLRRKQLLLDHERSEASRMRTSAAGSAENGTLAF